MDKGHAGSSVSHVDAVASPRLALAADLAAALIGMPDAVLVVDDAGEIVMANERVTALLGYTPADLVGRALEIVLPRGAGSLPRPTEGREMLARLRRGGGPPGPGLKGPPSPGGGGAWAGRCAWFTACPEGFFGPRRAQLI